MPLWATCFLDLAPSCGAAPPTPSPPTPPPPPSPCSGLRAWLLVPLPSCRANPFCAQLLPPAPLPHPGISLLTTLAPPSPELSSVIPWDPMTSLSEPACCVIAPPPGRCPTPRGSHQTVSLVAVFSGSPELQAGHLAGGWVSLLAFGARWFFVMGQGLCLVGCLAASLAPTQDARSTPSPGCVNRNVFRRCQLSPGIKVALVGTTGLGLRIACLRLG